MSIERSRPTLASVASRAGVSRTTASRALAHDAHPDVGPDTRERVRIAANELGYRPSVAAQALRTGRSNSICLLIAADEWIWWGVIAVGAVAEARKLGRTIRMESWNPAEDSVAEVRDRLKGHHDDGVIVVSMGIMPKDASDLGQMNVPVVFVDDANELPKDAAVVSSSNYDGAYIATSHLLQSGRQKVAGIFRVGPHRYVRERRAGYEAALRDHGITPSERLIAYSTEPYERPLDNSPAMNELLDRVPDLDAVFASADYLAATALKSLQARGIEVPTSVAVVGFDDERAALLTTPTLSTVRQPFGSLGAEAVRLIEATYSSPRGGLAPGRVELAVELVVRNSSGSTA